jgi:hypothetical protein
MYVLTLSLADATMVAIRRSQECVPPLTSERVRNKSREGSQKIGHIKKLWNAGAFDGPSEIFYEKLYKLKPSVF